MPPPLHFLSLESRTLLTGIADNTIAPLSNSTDHIPFDFIHTVIQHNTETFFNINILSSFLDGFTLSTLLQLLFLKPEDSPFLHHYRSPLILGGIYLHLGLQFEQLKWLDSSIASHIRKELHQLTPSHYLEDPSITVSQLYSHYYETIFNHSTPYPTFSLSTIGFLAGYSYGVFSIHILANP